MKDNDIQVKLPEFINHWVAQDREGYKNFVLFVTSMADFNVPDEDEPTRTALERSIKILEVTKAYVD